MSKRISVFIFLCTLFSGLLVASCAWARDGRVTLITFSHIASQLLPRAQRVNHSTFFLGGLAHAAGVAQQIREKKPDAILAMSGGSVFGPMWRYFGGEPEFTSLSIAGVQVGTIGTHELDYGWEHLKKALRFIRFPLVLSNVAVLDEEAAGAFRKNIVLPCGDLRVGFFAMLSPAVLATAVASPEIQVAFDIEAVAREMVKDLRAQGADVIVMLSNLTGKENRDLAERVSGIHVLLGHALSLNEESRPTFVAGPGGWLSAMVWGGREAEFVGSLQIDVADGKISREGVLWELVNVNASNVTPNPAIITVASRFEGMLSKQLETVVAAFASPVDTRKNILRSREMPIGNFITDAMRWRLGTDVALFNAGSIRGDRIFPAGPISERTLLEIFPFGNPFVVMRLPGKALRQMAELSASALAVEGDGYDASHRTPTGGFLQMSGLRVSYDTTRPPTTFGDDGSLGQWGSRTVDISVQKGSRWLPLDDGAEYSVALSTWLADGGDRYFLLKDLPRQDTEYNDMEVIMSYLQRFPGGALRLQNEGRIIVRK